MQTLPQNFIPDLHAEKLIAAHDGNVALLYVWLCRHRVYDGDKAAAELCLTRRETEAAYEKLRRMELAAEEKPDGQKLPPAEQLPEYTAHDIVRRTEGDNSFTSVINEAKRLYGRDLSSAELKTLFGIYDYLALPVDVIFTLLSYCFTVFAEKYGPGRQPSVRSIEKEAYSWANNEILTSEQAEEYAAKAAERRSREGEIKNALNIRGRALTATETKYIRSWLDMGFGADALAIAYDRTVTNTGSLKWSYMNKILQSWHEKGLHTPGEIEAKDGRSKAGVKPAAPNRGSVSDDELERLRAIYDKVKNN